MKKSASFRKIVFSPLMAIVMCMATTGVNAIKARDVCYAS